MGRMGWWAKNGKYEYCCWSNIISSGMNLRQSLEIGYSQPPKQGDSGRYGERFAAFRLKRSCSAATSKETPARPELGAPA